MNILLINCRQLEWMQESKGTIPVPLLHLASVLRVSGYHPIILDLSTIVVDEGVDPDQFILDMIDSSIEKTSPPLVAFNCFVSQHFPFIRKAAIHIRKHAPEIHISIGGVHPTLFAEEILANCSEIDSIIMGEGEEQICALAQAVAQQSLSGLSDVQAIAYRHLGRIHLNPRRHFITNLDSLPEPAWDLIDLTHYFADHSGWHNPKQMDIKLSIPILTSRSCPFDCNFCACHKTMGRTFRKRSPVKIVDEIEKLHKDLEMNYFGIIDDNVNLSKEHILGICNEIVRRKLDIQFEPTCGLYLGTVDRDISEALGKAGCVFARLPVEHGNDYIRNVVIGKKLHREQIFNAKKLLKENGMRVSTMSIMGFPEDTLETLQDTYDLLLELNADLNYVFNLIPFPGTRLFDQALEEGLLLGHYDTSALWKGEADMDPVQRIQQYYMKPRNMSLEELDYFREKFNSIRVMNPNL